jgi:hypothetical protein
MTINTSHKLVFQYLKLSITTILHFEKIYIKRPHIYSIHIKKRNSKMLQIEQSYTNDNSAYFEVVTVSGRLVWEDEIKFKLMGYSDLITIDD